ncbi:LegC family aminotransferase [Aurantimicrobium minutum]|uniref:LegC family aminotransferase n=1 Tax=Aurantimicrobium minutum TaxID=708131 RepID=UPI0024747B38|nr:LegC family aminotransferase [Aurantimicrobium minutum]MDH6256020.1 perosamine synthetase [Aurantimicrobium minutum]
MSLGEDVTRSIRTLVGQSSPIQLHEPNFTDIEHSYVNECLKSGFVSSVGPFVTEFEVKVAEFTGAKHAIAVSNGTSALQIALIVAGIKPNDEVIVPALSFVATANAVVHAGGVPFFVDSDADDLGMSPKSLRLTLNSFIFKNGKLTNPLTGRRIGAIVPMHTIGHPLKIQEIISIASEYGIPVVEDAAESLGSFVGEKHTGTFGKCGILSFNGNKTITTGGGGMIITNDDELASHAKNLTTTAKIPHPWKFTHSETAWNYRLPNLNAALGLAQLSRLPEILDQKRQIASRYKELFELSEKFDFICEPNGTTSNYWLCSIRLNSGKVEERDSLLETLINNGLNCRPLWELLSDLSMYSSNPRSELNVAKSLQNSVISLPSSPSIAHNFSS